MAAGLNITGGASVISTGFSVACESVPAISVASSSAYIEATSCTGLLALEAIEADIIVKADSLDSSSAEAVAIQSCPRAEMIETTVQKIATVTASAVKFSECSFIKDVTMSSCQADIIKSTFTRSATLNNGIYDVVDTSFESLTVSYGYNTFNSVSVSHQTSISSSFTDTVLSQHGDTTYSDGLLQTFRSDFLTLLLSDAPTIMCYGGITSLTSDSDLMCVGSDVSTATLSSASIFAADAAFLGGVAENAIFMGCRTTLQADKSIVIGGEVKDGSAHTASVLVYPELGGALDAAKSALIGARQEITKQPVVSEAYLSVNRGDTAVENSSMALRVLRYGNTGVESDITPTYQDGTQMPSASNTGIAVNITNHGSGEEGGVLIGDMSGPSAYQGLLDTGAHCVGWNQHIDLSGTRIRIDFMIGTFSHDLFLIPPLPYVFTGNP